MAKSTITAAEHHTYFVGSRDWGFSVWSHNICGQGWPKLQQKFFSFVARQGYTIENLFYTSGSWAASRAAARMGLGLSDLVIRNGVAYLGRTANATSFLRRDIQTLIAFLSARGARQGVVLSGSVFDPDLLKVLQYLARTGKQWPGLPGSSVTVYNSFLQTFRIFVPF